MTTSDHLVVDIDPTTGVAVLVGELTFATVGELDARCASAPPPNRSWCWTSPGSPPATRPGCPA
jgi:hypothetical protein